ncbi:phosphonate C-P lyase system protein PhnG [Metabacillus schmidteae]|uniref:phosphonate C-P lyase system protein PhnG n=1 Tax=Metabacillus schmidteae TaxID=2730405 RepID=UPI00158C3DEA|nr:phosphonate C-P lyase system protein PhnG [Metabacillus schmidteae]
MKKARLSKILVEGNKELVAKLATQIEQFSSIKIERSPQTGLVMMKTRDSVSKQPFYMGEVLITECVVEVNGTVGIGVLMGENPEKAYQMAIIDAAFNGNLPLLKEWTVLLEEEERKIIGRQKEEVALVSSSKVNFDTMEDYNDKG